MEGKLTLSLTEIITIVGAIAIPLCSALVLVYRRGEAKNKIIIDVTKSFIEVSKDHSKALENNTRVIEKLPETIMLHIKAKR